MQTPQDVEIYSSYRKDLSSILNFCLAILDHEINNIDRQLMSLFTKFGNFNQNTPSYHANTLEALYSS